MNERFAVPQNVKLFLEKVFKTFNLKDGLLLPLWRPCICNEVMSAERTAAYANEDTRLNRPIGRRNVWTRWQNHLFTGTSTVRSSTRSPSATPGKTQLCVKVVAPALLTLIVRHESRPDLHEHRPSCLILRVHKLRDARLACDKWSFFGFSTFKCFWFLGAMKWVLGGEFLLYPASVTRVTPQTVDKS